MMPSGMPLDNAHASEGPERRPRLHPAIRDPIPLPINPGGWRQRSANAISGTLSASEIIRWRLAHATITLTPGGGGGVDEMIHHPGCEQTLVQRTTRAPIAVRAIGTFDTRRRWFRPRWRGLDTHAVKHRRRRPRSRGSVSFQWDIALAP